MACPRRIINRLPRDQRPRFVSVLHEYLVGLPIGAFNITRLFRYLRVRRACHFPMVPAKRYFVGTFQGVGTVGNVFLGDVQG